MIFSSRLLPSILQKNFTFGFADYNGKIVFADLTITNYKRKRKIGEIIKKQFYFLEDKLIHESNVKNKYYNLQFILNEEKEYDN